MAIVNPGQKEGRERGRGEGRVGKREDRRRKGEKGRKGEKEGKRERERRGVSVRIQSI